MRKRTAKLRLDGEQTRIALIEAAGELAGDLGWANVKAKQVCERAGVNSSSVNYWFGSREALYEEVVAKIPDALIDESFFHSVVENKDIEVAIDLCINYLVENVIREPGWPIRVWVREVTGRPSKEFISLVQKRGVSRVNGMRRLLGAYLRRDESDPKVSIAIMNMMALMFLLMTVSPQIKRSLFPEFIDQSQVMMDAIKQHIQLSLQALRRHS